MLARLLQTSTSRPPNIPKIGKPVVEGAKVVAKVVEHGKADKIFVFKYKAKSNYRKRQGHRQPFTTVEITAINA